MALALAVFGALECIPLAISSLCRASRGISPVVIPSDNPVCVTGGALVLRARRLRRQDASETSCLTVAASVGGAPT